MNSLLLFQMKPVTVYKPKFTKIVEGCLGAEGPVLDPSGKNLYMVAPEVEKDGKPAGEVLKIDPVKKMVTFYIFAMSDLHII